jgi:hypothetical protein
MLHHTLQLEIADQRALQLMDDAQRHRAVRVAMSPRGTSPSVTAPAAARLVRRGPAVGEMALTAAGR